MPCLEENSGAVFCPEASTGLSIAIRKIPSVYNLLVSAIAVTKPSCVLAGLIRSRV